MVKEAWTSADQGPDHRRLGRPTSVPHWRTSVPHWRTSVPHTVYGAFTALAETSFNPGSGTGGGEGGRQREPANRSGGRDGQEGIRGEPLLTAVLDVAAEMVSMVPPASTYLPSWQVTATMSRTRSCSSCPTTAVSPAKLRANRARFAITRLSPCWRLAMTFLQSWGVALPGHPAVQVDVRRVDVQSVQLLHGGPDVGRIEAHSCVANCCDGGPAAAGGACTGLLGHQHSGDRHLDQ